MEDWSREWMLGENRRRSQCLGSVRQWGEPQGQSRSFSSFLHLSIMLQHIPCPLWKQLSQRMEVSWLWFLNKIERSAPPPHPPVVWASFYLGRTMMEIHEMVGIERQLRFALGQLNSFFSGGTRSTVLEMCLLPSLSLSSYSYLLSPKAVSCGIMTQKWALCQSSSSYISYSHCEKEGSTVSFERWSLCFFPPSTKVDASRFPNIGERIS